MKRLNPTLLKKYNVAGPRYTSYPTVPYWETNPTPAQWIRSIGDALSESETKKIGAAIYLHVPFCESLCTYCGCNTRITRNHSVTTPYIECIHREWKMYQQELGRTGSNTIPLQELHLGGGTPTFLKPDELKIMLDPIFNGTTLLKNSELSIEADPRVTTREHLVALQSMGFKRLSLGIQDFDPKVQEAVHRSQSVEQVQKIVDHARELGFESVNFDLIYGLPFQTKQSIQQTIEAVALIKPDRIAFYAYAHVPWIKPAHRRWTEADLPEPDLKRELYELGCNLLQSNQYEEIGMDHFALQTDSLFKAVQEKTLHRNFMGYIPRFVAPLIGLGVSSIGDSFKMFAQNEKQLEKYQELVMAGTLPIHRGHVLTEEDLVIRQHILNLMTRFETSWNDQESYTAYLESVPDKLLEFVKDGLLALGDRKCNITEEGKPFIRNICMAFDARLERKAPQTQLFSKTI